LKNGGNARGLLVVGCVDFTNSRVADIIVGCAERGVDTGVFAVDELALVDGARVLVVTSSNGGSAYSIGAESGDTSSGRCRSWAFRFNNTGGSSTSGDFTKVTTRDDTSGSGNALSIGRIASVVQARIRSSTDFRKDFTASWVFGISDDDLTRSELGSLLAVSSGGDANDTAGSSNAIDGFGASSLGFGDLVAIEWSLRTDSSCNVTDSSSTSIRDASSRTVGVRRRGYTAKFVDLNALSILAESRAIVGSRSTDLGCVFFTITSLGIASVLFHARIGWGSA